MVLFDVRTRVYILLRSSPGRRKKGLWCWVIVGFIIVMMISSDYLCGLGHRQFKIRHHVRLDTRIFIGSYLDCWAGYC